MRRKLQSGTFNVTKAQSICYEIRHTTGMYWADINTITGPKSITIQIRSDFGDWQYGWGAAGEDVAAFLRSLNIDYVAGKFGCDNHFNQEKTIAGLKALAEEHGIEMADDFKYLLEALEEHTDDREFQYRLYSDLPEEFDLHDIDIVREVKPQFVDFWEHIWPVFLDEYEKDYSVIPKATNQ